MKTIVYGASLKGLKHYIDGRECQDANSFSQSDFSEDEIKAIAVSDGHGGAQYLRSAEGAGFAVEIARSELYKFMAERKTIFDEIDKTAGLIDSGAEGIEMLRAHLDKLCGEINTSLSELKGNICALWGARVDAALNKNPLSVIDSSLVSISSVDGPPSVQSLVGYGDATQDGIRFISGLLPADIVARISKRPRSIYGATLLAAAQYKEHLILLQLGDGEITVVDERDEAVICFGRDVRRSGTGTDSLCMSDAKSLMEAEYLRKRVKVVMLSSDGLSDSLDQHADLGGIALALYEGISEESEEYRKNLRLMLRGLNFSDDLTVGIIANKIDDGIYETLRDQEEYAEDEAELLSAYVPMFKDYELDRSVYQLTPPEAEGAPVRRANFTKLGVAAVKAALLKDRYYDLIKAMKELDGCEWSGGVLGNMRAILERYLEENRSRLIKDQADALHGALNSMVHEKRVLLIKYTPTEISFSPEGVATAKPGEKRFSIVASAKDQSFSVVEIDERLFERLSDSFVDYVTFKGYLPLKNGYRLAIHKFNINIQKET